MLQGFLFFLATHFAIVPDPPVFEGLPLFYWHENTEVNFGDYLSKKIVERILNRPVQVLTRKTLAHKFLALGSILYFADEGDLVWGSGVNGKRLRKEDYRFKNLDVRAVRGPLTRQFLMDQFGIACPEIYGDPALLFPYLFPEFRKSLNPRRDCLVILHYKDTIQDLPEEDNDFDRSNVIHATEPWYKIIAAILDSKMVVSSSLHGIILAEAYGIPSRWLRVTEHEPHLKFYDYFLGTGRKEWHCAHSIKQALELPAHASLKCDLKKLYNAFPFESWSEGEPFQFCP